MTNVQESWVKINKGRLVRSDGCEVIRENSNRFRNQWVAMVAEKSGVRFALKGGVNGISEFESAQDALEAVESYLNDGA